MEAVAYDSTSADKLEFKPANVQPILQVSTKKFPEAFSQCKISANRRFLALNSKNPGFVKVFQRITARHIDLGELITGEVVALQFLAESDKFIVTSTEKEVVVVTMTENGDQSLSAAEQKFTLSAVGKKIAVYSEGSVEKGAFVLAEDGNVYDISISGSDAPKQVKSVAKTDSPFLASGAGILAAPGKDGAVQVFDISGGFSDCLSKPWFPHGGEAVTEAIVLSKNSGEYNLVTGAENNGELRFWTIKNQSASLNQTITLSGADKEAKRQLLVDPNGSYVAVLSSGDASAVMLEIDSDKFSIRRVTEWAGTSPFVCGTLFIRKVNTGAKLSQDLTLVARNSERLALLTFDAPRLEGAPNLGDVQEKKEKAAGGDDTILKWFGNKGGSADDNNGNVSIQSSNAKDSGKAAKEEAKNNAAVQAELAKITASVQSLLAQVKDGVESLQPMAGENLTLLQSSGFQDLADALGRSKALELNLPSVGGRGAVRDEKLRRLYTAIADQATAQMNNVASVSFDKTLKKNAERVGPKLASGSVTAKDIAIPKLGGTDSMRNFTLRMDKAHSTQNDVMRKQVESVRAQCEEIVAAAKKRSNAAMMTTKHHLKSVQTELAELKAEVATLSTIQPRAAGTVASSTSGGVPADKLAKCRALALGGNWEQAFAQLLEAANLSLLLQFLELDEVVDNRVKITSSGCLSFPIVLSLCQQLTHNVNQQAGVIPLRIGWLHDVLVGWDDEFTVLKGGSAADSELFFKCSGDFENMANIVSSINRGDVDAATRRQLMFVKKLLTNLV